MATGRVSGLHERSAERRKQHAASPLAADQAHAALDAVEEWVEELRRLLPEAGYVRRDVGSQILLATNSLGDARRRLHEVVGDVGVRSLPLTDGDDSLLDRLTRKERGTADQETQ